MGVQGGGAPIESIFGMKKDIPVVRKAYDLCKDLLPRVSSLHPDGQLGLLMLT